MLYELDYPRTKTIRFAYILRTGAYMCVAFLLMYVISALLGLSAVALTEVSSQIAIAIVCVVVAVVLFGAKKLGIFHMKDSAHQH